MPDTITCSNEKCKATISTKGLPIGEKVTCPKCGTVNQVLATFGEEFDLETFEPPARQKVQHHPARLKCTVCGALLGVRDAVCPKCGADVRSGVSVMRITAEEKKKRGLFGLSFSTAGAKAGSQVGTQVKRRAKKSSPAAVVFMSLGGMIVLAAIIVAVILLF